MSAPAAARFPLLWVHGPGVALQCRARARRTGGREVYWLVADAAGGHVGLVLGDGTGQVGAGSGRWIAVDAHGTRWGVHPSFRAAVLTLGRLAAAPVLDLAEGDAA